VTVHRQYLEGEAIITSDAFDALYRLESHTDGNGIVTRWHRDGAGHIIAKIEDEGRADLKTQFKRDAWGRACEVLDPNGCLTLNTYDRKDQLVREIIDPVSPDHPSGLNLIKQQQYNGQGKKRYEQKGDGRQLNQYDISYWPDGLNRDDKQIEDPILPAKEGGLNRLTALSLDKANQTVASIDPYGFASYYVYDECSRRRFKVNASGGVKEKQYNSEGQVTVARRYRTVLTKNLSEETTLADLMHYVAALACSEDAQQFYFYDDNGNCRFTVDGRGAAVEYRYNQAVPAQIIAIQRYYNFVDSQALPHYSTAQLLAVLQKNPHPKDATTYFNRDGLGRPCFTLDPEHVIIEKQFDSLGNIQVERRYGQKVADPAYLASLPCSQVASHLNANDPANSTIYTIYDLRSKPLFVVHPEGNVSAYDYDKRGNLKQEAEFAKRLDPLPTHYGEAVEALQGWRAQKEAGDRIRAYALDAVGRRGEISDPNPNISSYFYCNNK
jgi:YD repeat-containing protein